MPSVTDDPALRSAATREPFGLWFVSRLPYSAYTEHLHDRLEREV